MRHGYQYIKAEIVLTELSPLMQKDLLLATNGQSEKLMAALDAVNQRYGRETVRIAGSNIGRKWRPQSGLRSPNYTTDLEGLPVAQS